MKIKRAGQTGQDLAAELDAFREDFTARVTDRNADVQARLAELEAEARVLDELVFVGD